MSEQAIEIEENDGFCAEVGDPRFEARYTLLRGTTPETEGLWLRFVDTPGVIPLLKVKMVIESPAERFTVTLNDAQAETRIAVRRHERQQGQRRFANENRVVAGMPPQDDAG